MQKSRFSFIIFLFISFYSYSQDLSLQVLANQGNSSTIDGISLSWTIGEPIIETVENSQVILNQGFHQAVFNTTLNIDQENISSLAFWPNPVSNLLNINIESSEDSILSFSLFEVSGRFIKKKVLRITEPNIFINVSDLSSGIYMLHVTSSTGSINQTHKIIKY